MAGTAEARLKALGLALPPANAPAANYVPTVRTGNLVFVAGQIPMLEGKPAFIGKLGREYTVEQGQQAAKLCALSILAHMKNAVGDLDNIVRCCKVTGFVNAMPDFVDHPKVINGASDLLVAVLGDAGKHARAAIGMGSLPLGVAAEVDAIFEVK